MKLGKMTLKTFAGNTSHFNGKGCDGLEEEGKAEKEDLLDQNQICDISLLKINEKPSKDFDKDSLNFTKTKDDELKDLEFDHNEEEATITELVKASSSGNLIEESQSSTMRVAFGIILRLVLPLANGVVRGIRGMRDVRFLQFLRNLTTSRQTLTNLFAFAANTISLNLSAVQVSYRIEPILKLLKIRKSQAGLESLPDTPGTPGTPSEPLPFPNTVGSSSESLNSMAFSLNLPFMSEHSAGFPSYSPVSTKRKEAAREQEKAPKCCTLNILAEPPPGQPIRADIILIHGLHGSLVNTWKQGLWVNERQPENFQRPPKPPVRPPKRPRHSRTFVLKSPQKKKRARFTQSPDLFKLSTDRDTHDEAEEVTETLTIKAENDEFSYVCGEPEDIKFCNGVEYSFPAFHLRVNDSSRLLTNDIEQMLNTEDFSSTSSTETKDSNKKDKKKPSPNDPNYSKCWPGDWLPLDCPGVRVIAVNYTTDPYLWRPLWKKKEPRSNLIQRSREMAELLVKHRVGYGHPIIWVGHSKGGLFVKQIIVDAWESGRPSMAPFWRSARGVFFYSVPHRGSHLASIKAPLLARSVELIDIEKNNKYLLDLHRRFACLYHMGHLKIEVFSFVETALTLMSVLYLRIVGVDSADPGIGDVCGIRLDHREICKPKSRECILYKELVKMIKKVC